MRLFFFMLLLFNGAFLTVNALYKPEATQNKTTSNTSIPPLALLSEKEKSPPPTVNEKPTNTINNEPEEPALDLSTWLAKFTAETGRNKAPQEKTLPNNTTENPLQCYTAGPFQNSEKLQQATQFFNASQIQYQQRSIVENHYIGMLVYIPGQTNREAIVNIAKNLATKGVKDYMLLNEPGKRHALSLGVYGLKKNAEKRIEALKKLNYNAKSEARYRKKTIYWLDYALNTQDERTQLSAQQMKSLNVSQIERNCKT